MLTGPMSLFLCFSSILASPKRACDTEIVIQCMGRLHVCWNDIFARQRMHLLYLHRNASNWKTRKICWYSIHAIERAPKETFEMQYRIMFTCTSRYYRWKEIVYLAKMYLMLTIELYTLPILQLLNTLHHHVRYGIHLFINRRVATSRNEL